MKVMKVMKSVKPMKAKGKAIDAETEDEMDIASVVNRRQKQPVMRNDDDLESVEDR